MSLPKLGKIMESFALYISNSVFQQNLQGTNSPCIICSKARPKTMLAPFPFFTSLQHSATPLSKKSSFCAVWSNAGKLSSCTSKTETTWYTSMCIPFICVNSVPVWTRHRESTRIWHCICEMRTPVTSISLPWVWFFCLLSSLMSDSSSRRFKTPPTRHLPGKGSSRSPCSTWWLQLWKLFAPLLHCSWARNPCSLAILATCISFRQGNVTTDHRRANDWKCTLWTGTQASRVICYVKALFSKVLVTTHATPECWRSSMNYDAENLRKRCIFPGSRSLHFLLTWPQKIDVSFHVMPLKFKQKTFYILVIIDHRGMLIRLTLLPIRPRSLQSMHSTAVGLLYSMHQPMSSSTVDQTCPLSWWRIRNINLSHNIYRY